ncbi:hypothetical protein [Limnohabitans radicicola]|uniref:Type 4 fimbrial biogenesis protein PilX N-terminal domain-containing protein n=1 Tax=Limnohabitans radicicola TaxID=2771427 RepID=A0A927ILY3_9BURK|nr:hypothetical protein [Limnohabitans radicicola]MBD8050616.1 hypothetical protein [Limnohabitans radicicola]
MNHSCPQTTDAQHGAITLLVAIALVVLAALAGFYSSRSVLMDQLAGQNHARASQARLLAEAALASAQADIASRSAPLTALLTTPAPCPAGVKGPQWQCAALSVPPHPALPQAQASVTAVRDLVMAPHVLTLHAQSHWAGQNSRGLVRESVFLPVLAPAPSDAPQAALVLNGCVSEATGASLRVCPLSKSGQPCSGTASAPAVQTHFVIDTNRNGSISSAEKTACMALSSASLPGGGTRSGPSSAVPRSPCNRAAWRSVLGDITAEQLQAWSAVQERNGLHALSTPPRSIYWINSPADWGQSVGTPDTPALLVFSSQACALRCPRIAPGVHIHGSVVLDAGCDDEKMRGWQGGWIEGQLVVESGLPEWRTGTLWARPYGRNAYILDWPDGIDASRVQRVNGSWSEGSR